MNKKTKTVTFHSATNYGAILQTIGLQKALNNLGYENQVIDYTDKCMYQYNPLNFKNISFKEKVKKIIKFIIFGLKLETRYIKFNNFIKNKIVLSQKISKPEEMMQIIDKNDILITGSDQVWNPEIFNDVSDFYMLKYSEDSNYKLSYAASLGKADIDEKYIGKFKENLNNFNKVSVRELAAKDKLSDILNRSDIEVVLDPTLLLNKEQWENEIKANEISINKKYIVAYTMEVNEEYIKIVNELSQRIGLKVIYFDYRNFGFKNVLKEGYTYNPYQFLNIIKNAEYVVTNSFHGTVFSIIFNKIFWTIPHKTKGIRMIDLLNKLDINDRIVYTLEEFALKADRTTINYKRVNELLDRERIKSIEWLKEALKNGNEY